MAAKHSSYEYSALYSTLTDSGSELETEWTEVVILQVNMRNYENNHGRKYILEVTCLFLCKSLILVAID